MAVREGYKHTEVGVIPEDWEVKSLNEVAFFCNGKAHEQCIDEMGKFVVVNSKFISTQGVVSKNSKKCISPLNKGDITMVMSDIPNGKALARCYTIPEDNKYTLNQRICSISSKSVDNDFLGLILNRNKYYLYFDSGTGQTNLRRKDVLDCPLQFPPTKAEQTAIANALSDVDALIQSLSALIAKKHLIKQGAMQTLLNPYDEAGQLKDGWVVKKLPEVCWYQEGPGVRNSQFTKSGVKLLNGTNIENGKLLLDKTNRYISEKEAYGWYSHFLANEGDILIACSGITVDKFHEKVTVISKEYLPLCMNTSTMRFKVDSKRLQHSYLIHFLRSRAFKDQIGGMATGSAQLNFGPSHVNSVDIYLPMLNEQAHVAGMLSDMDSEITSLETKLSKYQAIKQGMMQNLLTGHIRLIQPEAMQGA